MEPVEGDATAGARAPGEGTLRPPTSDHEPKSMLRGLPRAWARGLAHVRPMSGAARPPLGDNGGRRRCSDCDRGRLVKMERSLFDDRDSCSMSACNLRRERAGMVRGGNDPFENRAVTARRCQCAACAYAVEAGAEVVA